METRTLLFTDMVGSSRMVRDYLEAGTPMVWVLDPYERLIAVFRPGLPVRFLGPRDVLDGEDVLVGFRLELRRVFR